MLNKLMYIKEQGVKFEDVFNSQVIEHYWEQGYIPGRLELNNLNRVYVGNGPDDKAMKYIGDIHIANIAILLGRADKEASARFVGNMLTSVMEVYGGSDE